MSISLHQHPTPGFSVRITVARENCNITGEYFERGSMSAQNIVRLSNFNPRILHNKRRVLWSPLLVSKLSRGALTAGRKGKESLQSHLRNLNSASSTPVAPRRQGCQFWPISTEWKWASHVHKQTKKQMKPWKYGHKEKMKHQKVVEFSGARSKD